MDPVSYADRLFYYTQPLPLYPPMHPNMDYPDAYDMPPRMSPYQSPPNGMLPPFPPKMVTFSPKLSKPKNEKKLSKLISKLQVR